MQPRSPRLPPALAVLADFMAEREGILTQSLADRIIDQALGNIHCNACGAKGLVRVPRKPGEPDYIEGKQRAVCGTCHKPQWNPCSTCGGEGKVLSPTLDEPSLFAECPGCGGSGLGKPVESAFNAIDGAPR